MRKKSIKILSLLLTLALLVGLLSGMTAFADTGSVYLVGDTIKTDDCRFYIAQYASGNAEKVYTGTNIYKGLGTAPIVDSAEEARVNITPGGSGGVAASSFVYDENEAKGSKRTPIGVRIASSKQLPQMAEDQRAVVLELVYGFTVTYAPGEEATLNQAAAEGLTVKDGSIVRPVASEDASTYKVEGFDSCFNAPEGKQFDVWKDLSADKTYRTGSPLPLTGNVTLTAQWKDKSQGGGSRGGLNTNGADVVFNIPGADDGWEYIGGGVPQRAYRLSLAPMQGGSAYFMLTSGENGETMNVYPQTSVRVVPTPAPGYRLASIVWSMIDGSASYDITESQTFVMPAMDAVVYVTFQPVA